MSDEDLRELERRAALDGAQALRFARALARQGDVARAAKELARVVASEPANHEALSELDRLTRGGVDPSSPWPGHRGDGRHSGRSTATGPLRGGQLARATFDAGKLRAGTAVDARGRLVVVSGEELIAVDPLGAIEKLGAATGEPLLLAETPVVFGADRICIPGRGMAQVAGPWVAGLGHIVFAKAKHRIEARQLPTHDAPLRWAAPIPRPAALVAFGPGALVLVLTRGGLGARGSFHRFELATGRALPPISLERLGTQHGWIIAREDGVVFLGLSSSTVALDPEGKTIWRHERSGRPVALAGANADVLVVSDLDTLAPYALDAATGEGLWESRDACLNDLPLVDATGRIFWRREEELVAFEPRTGEVVYQALVGGGFWDFAFDGRGRALVLRYGSRPELVLLE